jgi:hypothetical protein
MRKKSQIIKDILTFMSLLAALEFNHLELLVLALFIIVVSKPNSDFIRGWHSLLRAKYCHLINF